MEVRNTVALLPSPMLVASDSLPLPNGAPHYRYCRPWSTSREMPPFPSCRDDAQPAASDPPSPPSLPALPQAMESNPCSHMYACSHMHECLPIWDLPNLNESKQAPKPQNHKFARVTRHSEAPRHRSPQTRNYQESHVSPRHRRHTGTEGTQAPKPHKP